MFCVTLFNFSAHKRGASAIVRIAGTSGARTFKREVFLQFLRNKQWIIEEIEDIPDVEPSALSVTEMEKEPTKPKQHIIFTSFSENYSRVPSLMNQDEEKYEERYATILLIS